MNDILFRELPIEEHGRLARAYAETEEPASKREQTIAYVAEHENEIVGCVTGQRVILIGPLWVREDFRGNHISERLIHEGYRFLPDWQKIVITSNPLVERLAHAMGFVPRVGQLWHKEE